MAWSLSLAVIWSIAATAASWRLAAKQGRNAGAWAIASLLFSGLPLIWLVIHALFDPPRPATAHGDEGRRQRHRCCENQSWVAVADFGHAGGVDLDLGRCASCGAYLMAVFYVSSTSYVAVSDEQARDFLALLGTPALKKALKAWVG